MLECCLVNGGTGSARCTIDTIQTGITTRPHMPMFAILATYSLHTAIGKTWWSLLADESLSYVTDGPLVSYISATPSNSSQSALNTHPVIATLSYDATESLYASLTYFALFATLASGSRISHSTRNAALALTALASCAAGRPAHTHDTW